MGTGTPIYEEVVMRRSAAIGICIGFVVALLGISGLAAAASPGDVVINEIYPNAPTYFDGSEYIELYNTTGSAIDISGWILTGTEYDQTCTGDRDHIFPAGTTIPAGGYILIARDALNDDNDGFKDEFPNISLDFEMVDPNADYDVDDPTVPNMVMGTTTEYDDQIRLYPGSSDYAKYCGTGRYEALLLLDDSAVLIDHVEYRSSSCTSDQCAGLGTSDNDAYPAYPDQGLSLGRLDTSADTDNCANDFIWEAPTPGEQNVNGVPPDIFSLDYSPCVPGPTDSVTIDCYAIENGAGIKWVKCIYKQGGAPWDTLDMYQSVTEDSLYYVNLPPRPNQTQSLFYIWASDTLDITGIYPADAKDDPYRYSVGLTDISVIQEVDVGDDSSYVAGQAKNITGVVTAGRGTYSDAIFVVQQGVGDWSGIHVYDPSYSVPAALGDSVILSGRVQEYYNLTELYLFTGCYTEVSSGNPVYETVVSTGDLNTGGAANPEVYEGVLVRVDNVTVTNEDLGYGEWEINDGSGPCIVDDLAYYAYNPKTGHVLDAVRGVCEFAYDFYKIQPRNDDDIIGALTVTDVRYTPHAPTTTDVVTVSANVFTNKTIDYVYVYYNTDGGAVYDSTLMSAVDDTTYSGDIGPFTPDHTIVHYYVGARDNSGSRVQVPEGFDYRFRIGEHTIYEVQSTFASDGDSSLFARDYEPVNVKGVVTVGEGEFQDFDFFISMPNGGPYKGMHVIDWSGTAGVIRGDSVTVSGYVGEYFNETQMVMPFGEAITVHSTGNPVPEAYRYPPSTGTIDSEEWECVLVNMIGSEIVAYYPDFPAVWHISNTGSDLDTCRVNDPFYIDYTPVVGNFVNVRGVMRYAYKSFTIWPRDSADVVDSTTAGIVDPADTPVRLALSVTPNPMNLSSNVKFALPSSGRASIKVYNIHGQMVETLVDGNVDAGEHNMHWDGTNYSGNKVTSGIYFFKLETGKGSVISKVVVSR
jgi:hypothetical protein